MPDVLISVVIPTRNRPKEVVSCLDALALQSVSGDSFEVIVVDDGGTPPLKLDFDRWPDSFSISLIHQKNTGPAGARNAGVAAARGGVVAFTDDDCRPSPHWIEMLGDALRNNPEALVGGSVVNGLKSDIFAEASQIILDMVYEHFNADQEAAFFFASNNMACSRSGYVAVGGFDEKFPTPAGEDRDFSDRWRSCGRYLRYVPDATIEHRHALTARKFFWMYYRYGQGAHRFSVLRRSRRSGAMSQDLAFHASLPVRVIKHLRRVKGFSARIGICFALALWQFANAVGFLSAMFGDASLLNRTKR